MPKIDADPPEAEPPLKTTAAKEYHYAAFPYNFIHNIVGDTIRIFNNFRCREKKIVIFGDIGPDRTDQAGVDPIDYGFESKMDDNYYSVLRRRGF